VDNGNGRPGEPDDGPPAISRTVTVNQVVAWNIARYRKAAGLTQAELGVLTARSKRNISADERSWDGTHTREFNAHELAGLSRALGVPIVAFFLPPDDDGAGVRYLYRPPGADTDLDMAALMAGACFDSDDDGDAMELYRDRMRASVRRYIPGWEAEVAQWLAPLTSAGQREEAVYRLRAILAVLSGEAPVIGRLADAIAATLDEEEAG
jgi:transcriptional regulator with XRE-family HTH domain